MSCRTYNTTDGNAVMSLKKFAVWRGFPTFPWTVRILFYGATGIWSHDSPLLRYQRRASVAVKRLFSEHVPTEGKTRIFFYLVISKFSKIKPFSHVFGGADSVFGISWVLTNHKNFYKCAEVKIFIFFHFITFLAR